MNQDAIIGLAIGTAAYWRNWTGDSTFEEIYEDFGKIAEHAQGYLDWVGIKDYQITEEDVCFSLGFGEYEECLDEYVFGSPQ